MLKILKKSIDFATIVFHGNIQINTGDNSGRLMELSSKGIMNGRVSTNILLTRPSEIQGRSFIIKTANGDKFKAYATDPEAIQLLIDN